MAPPVSSTRPPHIVTNSVQAIVGSNRSRIRAAETTNNNTFLRVSAYNLTSMSIVKKEVEEG